jgi:hypothetical protein
MQEPYTQLGAPAKAPAPVTNHGITSLAEAHARIEAFLRQRRVQQLIEQMRAQARLRQAMQAWRALVRRPSRPALAGPTLHALLHQAAVWLRAHPHHPDALAVAMHLERIAPGWRIMEKGAFLPPHAATPLEPDGHQGQRINRKAGQGGA